VRRIGIALSVLVLFGALAVVPAAAHDAPNRCGDSRGSGAGWWKLRGHATSCPVARTVARRWEERCAGGSQPCRENRPVTIRANDMNFECTYRQYGYESVRVRCVGPGTRVVHFLWGS
jgi:hypothetical protein